MKKIIVSAFIMLLALGCKKKTEQPADPALTTTGTPPASTTKTISFSISTNTVNGVLSMVWNYDHSDPLNGLTQYTLTSASQTFSQSVRVEADSIAFGYTGPPPNNTPISYSVYVNGNIVKSDQNTMTLGAAAKIN